MCSPHLSSAAQAALRCTHTAHGHSSPLMAISCMADCGTPMCVTAWGKHTAQAVLLGALAAQQHESMVLLLTGCVGQGWQSMQPAVVTSRWVHACSCGATATGSTHTHRAQL